MTFISFAGGMLLAFLIVGILVVMWSCLSSYQIRMMEQLRKTKNQVYDLHKMLENQDERLCEVRQYLSKIEAEKNESHRSTAVRPSGSAVSANTSSLMKSVRTNCSGGNA